jgi:hypothetical protein
MAGSRKFYKIKEGNARGFGIETKPDDESGPMGVKPVGSGLNIDIWEQNEGLPCF